MILNRLVPDVLGERIAAHFVEVVEAPEYEPGALEALRRKESLRILQERERRSDTPGELDRSEEHTSELQSQSNLVCRLLLEKKKIHQHLQIRHHPPLQQNTAVVQMLAPHPFLEAQAAPVNIVPHIDELNTDVQQTRQRDSDV